MSQIPTWLAKKKGVDLDLVNKLDKIEKAFKDMGEQLDKQKLAPERQAVPLEQPPERLIPVHVG
jgi:hypothetical protein